MLRESSTAELDVVSCKSECSLAILVNYTNTAQGDYHTETELGTSIARFITKDRKQRPRRGHASCVEPRRPDTAHCAAQATHYPIIGRSPPLRPAELLSRCCYRKDKDDHESTSAAEMDIVTRNQFCYKCVHNRFSELIVT